MEIKRNTDLLIKNVERVKLIKAELEKELQENYCDELLTKIVKINKVIKKAEFLITATTEEVLKKFPSQIDKDGKITEKGIKRLDLLNKKMGPFKG